MENAKRSCLDINGRDIARVRVGACIRNLGKRLSPPKVLGREGIVHLSEMFHLKHLPNCTDLQSVSTEAK